MDEHICSVECTWALRLAFLFHPVTDLRFWTLSVNVKEGDPNERPMTTGVHIVRDIFCVKCDAHVGWKYVSNTLPPHLMLVARRDVRGKRSGGSLFMTDVFLRTVRTKHLRNIKKANSFWREK